MLGAIHAELGATGIDDDSNVHASLPLKRATFLTCDPHMLEILQSLSRVRDSSIPVLILGESGVGKEVLARAIHEGGRSRTGKFIALNSGAIPAHLQESELFGHVKGAFTDADRDREGLVAAATDGTLFLDEIGEMSPELQVKLLRFLQSGEYRRVGESIIRASNARVISASNVDLREMAGAGRFRRDLFYRLSAFAVRVPALRDRPQDVPLLMEHFLKLYSRIEGKRVRGFTDDVRELFLRHDWRGNNVRELENEVRRGVALCEDGGLIGIDALRPELAAKREAIGRSNGNGGPSFATLRDEVEALERSRIAEALERCGDSKRKAAKVLGLSRTGLYTKLRKYGMG
jgi:DNA-binding NtrC family response regulator